MPTVFKKFGYRFHFYSNERQEPPPHIHVTGKGGEMKVWLADLIVEFSYGVSPSEQRKIMGVIKEKSKVLMEAWNEFSSKKR
ncbi:MAG: DUF4160 domain-containing protein [Deltaproteobacteria bacterium]|nr:DUF4160 domain-containing protein [Deltaproteobacteria bacterium]